MSLFEKFKGTIDSVKTSVMQAAENEKKKNDPLSDPTVKKYFEIICGMRKTFLLSGPENVTDNTLAKNYIEYYLGGPCDIVKLEKTLELYNMSRKDSSSDPTEKRLLNFRKSLIESNDYRMDRFEATRTFCQKEIERAAIEYELMLNVIKDNVNHKHFAQGMNKLQFSSAIKDIVVVESFLEGNPITKEIVLDYILDLYRNRVNKSNAFEAPLNAVSALVLRALNFEKYGKEKSGYKTVSDLDYQNFVLTARAYQNAINDNPFERESSVEKFAQLIKECKILKSTYSSYRSPDCFYFGIKDDYFTDAVCHLTWKTIAHMKPWEKDGINISSSNDASDILDILITYFKA